MRKSLLIGNVLLALLFLPQSLSAYIMAKLTYEELFERAEIVVIATPVSTHDSSVALELKVKQSKEITDLIKTVDTKFQVGHVLKGKLESKVVRLLHLSLKGKKPKIMVFGSVGTFFWDFDSKNNKNKSYILFMIRQGDRKFIPAWRPMEGGRAIIQVSKDGQL